MGKRMDKIAGAAHIKKNTHGTSNEISFSVLDAAKQSLDGGKKNSSKKTPSLGFIPIFTLRGRRKPPATPVKEQGLLLSSGEFISTESSSPQVPLLAKASAPSNGMSESASAAASVSNEVLTNAPLGQAQVSGVASSGLAGAASASASQSVPSWSTPVDEVARRKASRKKRKAVAVTAFMAACFLLVAVAVFVAYEALQVQKTAKGKLISQIEVIADADTALLSLDEMVVAIINDGWAEGAAGISADYWALEADLEESAAMLTSAITTISQVQVDLQDPYDQEAAVQAIVAAKARLSMIEAGRNMAEIAIGGQNAYAHAEEAWICLVEADSLAREAAQLVSNTSVENVKQSMTLTKDALDALAEAPDHLTAAENELGGLEYSSYRQYIELRTESLEHALLSDQAYLDRDKEKAAQENELYNDLDKQAVQVAQEIGSDTAEMVLVIIDPLVDQDADIYAAQRVQASTADATLREYLAEEA